MTIIGDAALETRCRSLVKAIALPQPFSLHALVDVVARRQGEDIRLQALPDAVGPGISGMVVRTTDGYVISYPDLADPWWSLVCVCHELSHILWGHVCGLRRADSDHGQDDHRAVAPSQPEPWLPDMQEAYAAWGGRLYRGQTYTVAEQEAELTATLLVQRIERIQRQAEAGAPLRSSLPAHVASNDHVVLDRFSQLLGTRRDRRR